MDKYTVVVAIIFTVSMICQRQTLETEIRLIDGGEEKNKTSKEIIIEDNKINNKRNITPPPNSTDENLTNLSDKNPFKDRKSNSSSVATAAVLSVIAVVVVVTLVSIVAVCIYRRWSKGKDRTNVSLQDVSSDESSSSRKDGERKHDNSGSEDDNLDDSGDVLITP